jgi:hypothetical protein
MDKPAELLSAASFRIWWILRKATEILVGSRGWTRLRSDRSYLQSGPEQDDDYRAK